MTREAAPRTLALAMVIGFVLLAFPATAAPGEAPDLASFGAIGAGWIAARGNTSGALQAEFRVELFPRDSVTVVQLFDPTGRMVTDFRMWVTYGNPWVVVDEGHPSASATFVEATVFGLPRVEVRLIVPEPPDEYLLVAWAAGGVSHRELRILNSSGDDNATIVGAGNRAWYSRGEDFEHERPSAIVHTRAGRITHESGGTRSLEIQGVFLGDIGAAAHSPDFYAGETRLRGGPDFGERACPCEFRNLTGPTALTAGAYTILRDVTSVDRASPPPPAFVGVDVVL